MKEAWGNMPEQRNLILAIVLSVTIILAFQYFYELPRVKEAQRQPAPHTEQTVPAPRQAPGQAGAPAGPASVAPGVEAAPAAQTRAEVLAGAQRLPIEAARVHGSLPVTGGRIDDVVLSDYHVTPAPTSPDVALLSPPGEVGAGVT